MEDFDDERENGGSKGNGMIEEAPYYESRVQRFLDMYMPSSMESADAYFDDIKLRDFFGCESREFMKDGLVKYREALIGLGFVEMPCLWLGGKMCFPVKERWEDV